MRRLLLLWCVTLVAGLVNGQPAREWWVTFDSKENRAGQAPILHVRGADGFEIALHPAADGVLLSYLGKRNFGRHPNLPVGLHDKNRSLLRFVLPKRLARTTVVAAELRLTMQLGNKAPRQPFEIGVHPVGAAWQEAKVTWDSQPDFEATPAITAKLQPKPSQVRIDLTELVEAWRSGKRENHGVLLKVAGLGPGAALVAKLPGRLLQTVPWSNDVQAALAKAKRNQRLVLTCVRPAYRPDAVDASEQLLQATVFCDPAIVKLVEQHFVPLRLGYVPTIYTRGAVRGTDPLAAVGGDSTRIKALALCVSTPGGELLASVDSIGTFDVEFFHRFLLDAARKSGRAIATPDSQADKGFDGAVQAMRRGEFAGAATRFVALLARRPPSRRVPEAMYWLGCLQRVTGEEKLATATLARLHDQHPESLWALKAATRLAWPHRIDPIEHLRRIPVAETSITRTEQPVRPDGVDQLVEGALRYLVEQQRADGSWPSEALMYQPAITALAAKAIDTWIPHHSDRLRPRLQAAAQRATGWIDRYLDKRIVREANSFGAAYILDFLLARHQRQPEPKLHALVQRAVEFLAAGQCPDGAWSYSYQFGTNWRGGFGGWPKTTKGRTHSCNTGPALTALALAKARGFAVDANRLARGMAVLDEMRVGPGVYTYTYPEPLNFRRPDQSIARGPVCEHALFAGGESTREDLAAALQTFMHHHDGLRRAKKIDASWATRSNFSCYFYFYAYYHAAHAARALGGDAAKPILAAIRQEILATAEIDGTWVDFPQTGKPYGTAMALLLLEMTRSGR